MIVLKRETWQTIKSLKNVHKHCPTDEILSAYSKKLEKHPKINLGKLFAFSIKCNNFLGY